MMKYRRLDQNELKTLEKDFIEFLASQSITADEWENMRKEQQLGLIDIFSDLVFEKVLGVPLKLSQCFLDGHSCCEFEPAHVTPQWANEDAETR